MSNRTLADGWADFEKTVVPASAGPVQRRVTKNAFYGGARVLLTIMERRMNADNPTEGAAEAIIDLEVELKDFIDGVVARAEAAAKWEFKRD